jgi:hypothetical protein
LRDAELDVTKMEENWLLVWFAGAQGWTNWDTPWAVFLQHNPTSMHLDDAGLHISFPERRRCRVDAAVWLLQAAAAVDPLAGHGLPSKDQNLGMAKALPRNR